MSQTPSPESRHANRRDYLRMSDEISLSVERLDSAAARALSECFDATREQLALVSELLNSREQMLPLMRQIERRQPEIASYLKSLERRIALLGARWVEQQTQIDPLVRQSVNLSASGLQFVSGDYYKPGERLKLTLMLYPEQLSVLAMATVQRSEPVPPAGPDEGERWRTSVHFSQLHEHDQELLVKHIYQCQIASLKRHDEVD